MKADVGVVLEKGFDLRRFVGRQVVENDMDFLMGLGGPDDLFDEAYELTAGVHGCAVRARWRREHL